MKKLIEDIIRAHKVFVKIIDSFFKSSYNLNKNIITQILDDLAPLDYIETHYNLHKELEQYNLEKPQTRIFNENLKVKKLFSQIKEDCAQTDEYTDRYSYTSFIGDVYIKGNLDIEFGNKFFILGNLIVDKVITCEQDAMLMVSGSIRAKSIVNENSCVHLASICAEKIEISDIIYINEFSNKYIYAGEVQSNIIVLEKDSIENETKKNNIEENFKYEKKINRKTISRSIKELFNPIFLEILNNGKNQHAINYYDIYGIKFNIIEFLKTDMISLNKDDSIIKIDTIWENKIQ